MADDTLINRYAFEAACAMVSRSLVFMVPSRTSETATEVGSGTVVLTPKGAPVILTAWHVAVDANTGPLSIGYQFCQRALDDVAERVYQCPGDVDVGIVVPKANAAQVLLEFARPASVVAASSDTDVTDNTPCVIGGYPWAFEAKRDDHDRRIHWQVFASATFDCVIARRDQKGRYEVRWEERSFGAHKIPSAWDRVIGEDLRAPRVLPRPNGMSGGSLWRFEVSPKGELWSPTACGKIVGVQCSWNQEDLLYVESVASWGDWFHEVLADVDARNAAASR